MNPRGNGLDPWDQPMAQIAAQNEVLVMMQLTNKPVQIKTARESLAMEAHTIKRVINRLVDAGVVERVGGRKVQLLQI